MVLCSLAFLNVWDFRTNFFASIVVRDDRRTDAPITASDPLNFLLRPNVLKVVPKVVGRRVSKCLGAEIDSVEVSKRGLVLGDQFDVLIGVVVTVVRVIFTVDHRHCGVEHVPHVFDRPIDRVSYVSDKHGRKT